MKRLLPAITQLQITITAILLIMMATVAHSATGRNLLQNASFEEASVGTPWHPFAWDEEGLATANTAAVGEAWHGETALRMVNHSTLAPNIYRRIYQCVPVKPHTDYVFSLYVRCADVRKAWFGGGPAWNVRQPIPQNTEGKWVRVSTTFNSGDADSWEAMVLTEDETAALDIDALQIEEGTAPAAFDGPPCKAWLENTAFAGIYATPASVKMNARVTNYTATPLPVRITWTLHTLPGERTLDQRTIRSAIAGHATAAIALPVPPHLPYGLYEYRATIAAGGREIPAEARIAIVRPPVPGRELDALGLNIHVANDDTARLVRRMGLRWVRVDWNWDYNAPSREAIIWQRMDAMVSAADKYGLKLFPVLAYTPTWAILPDGTFSPADHASYVRQVLERYKGKITAFDVWNEPEGGAIAVGNSQKFWAEELRAVRDAAKAVDPQVKVVGLAVSGNPGDPGGYYPTLLQPPYALGQYLDAYDWHNYPAPRNRRPEDTERVGGIDRLREWVGKTRDVVHGREVWITEGGFTTCDPAEPRTAKLYTDWPAGAPWHTTEQQQGDYLTRQAILQFAYGIDKSFLYQLGPDGPGGFTEEQFGITRVRANGLSPKVAWVQLAVMVGELAGSTPVAVDGTDPNLRVATFRRGPQTIVAAWTVHGTAVLPAVITGGYRCDPYGNRTPQQGKIRIALSESPVFLVGKRVQYYLATGK